jgi:hypothetical protein
MKKFLEEYKSYKQFKRWSQYYRFCWIPVGKEGYGIWSIIEFFDDELDKIDKNKCEIVQK